MDHLLRVSVNDIRMHQRGIPKQCLLVADYSSAQKMNRVDKPDQRLEISDLAGLQPYSSDISHEVLVDLSRYTVEIRGDRIVARRNNAQGDNGRADMFTDARIGTSILYAIKQVLHVIHSA